MRSPRGGPAARVAINPVALVGFLDAWSEYVTGGIPRRRRLTINGTSVTENDARMIRRWRVGKIQGVTVSSAQSLLDRHDLSLAMYAVYCWQVQDLPTLRGKLPPTTQGD